MRATRFLTAVVPAVYQGVALFLIVAALAIADILGVSGLASLGAVVLIMLRALNYGQSAQVAFQALHESVPYLETLEDEQQRYAAAAVPRTGDPVGRIGEITFEGVCFQYPDGPPVLHDASFTVGVGEIIGIVGPSGAGKSTLVQLILRLREPTTGRISADGRDVRDLRLDDWNRHITFVPQEARLFAPARWRRTSGSSATTWTTRPSHERPGARISTRRSCGCRSATTRRWASGAAPCRVASASDCASPARSSASPRSSSWTSRPVRSIRGRRRSCARRSASSRPGRPCS